MDSLAIALVLLAALLHAVWNWLAKRTGSTLTFVWLFDAFSLLFFAPVALIALAQSGRMLEPLAIFFIVGSAFLHLGYYLYLGRAYRVADLSLVYPLARGTAPMLSTLGAVLLLGERPTPLALLGITLIACGIFLLTGHPRKLFGANAAPGVAAALLTSAFIASYTLWDKVAVAELLLPPLFYGWAYVVIEFALLTPLAWRRRAQVAREWRAYKREALAIALFNPLAYMLVLVALSFTSVSYVAPLRELSTFFGVILGARLLAEGQTRQRLIAAAILMSGVVLLTRA